MLFRRLIWQKSALQDQSCFKLIFSTKSGQSRQILGKKSECQKIIFPKNVDMVPNNHHMVYGSKSTSQNGVMDVFVHIQKKKTLVPCPELTYFVWRGVKTGTNYPHTCL